MSCFFRQRVSKGLAALVVIPALMVGLVGLGPAGLALERTSESGCCSHEYCGTELAGIQHDGEDGSHPGDDGHGEQCPPGCDCVCCPGAVVVLMPSGAPSPRSDLACAAVIAPCDGDATGFEARVFHPPKPSLV